MSVFIGETLLLLRELQPFPSTLMVEGDKGQALCMTELIALLASVSAFH